jgi:hypothetical protein
MATRKRPAEPEDVIAHRLVKPFDVDVEVNQNQDSSASDIDQFLEICANECTARNPESVETPGNPVSPIPISAVESSCVQMSPQMPESETVINKISNNIILNDELPSNPARFSNSDIANNTETLPDCGDFYNINARKVHNAENPTLNGILKSSDIDYWKEALKDEVLAKLLKPFNVSMKPVRFEDIPRGALITYLQFVFKKKIKKDREDKFKARRCLRGDQLPKGLVETFAPTVSSVSCAALQQLAVIDDMNQALVDTVGAFLGQDYPDDLPALYVKLPREVALICGLDPAQVYRVVKYLYGIPDAGRAYYVAYRDHLVSKGYVQSAMDPCLFFTHVNHQYVYAWIHVDDTWVATSTPRLLDAFIKDVQSHFEVTVDDIDNYLGVHYEKLVDGSLRKTQPKLLQDLFVKHDIHNRPMVKTPAAVVDPNVVRDCTPCDTTRFLSLIGVLLYVLFSRPDVGFAVSWAASKANQPTMADWADLIRVVQYLYQTKDKGLIIRKQPKGCPLQMYIHVDASYLLYSDSKAQTGYCFSFNNCGTFYSKSQKQPGVTTSSSHSEMRAMFMAVVQYIYIMLLFEEIGRPLTSPAIIYEDNQAVVTLVTRERSTPKMCKHFLMLINYVRELVSEKKIEVRKIPTWENYSDIFTKHVQGKDFAYKCQQVLGAQEGEDVLEPVVPYKPVVM